MDMFEKLADKQIVDRESEVLGQYLLSLTTKGTFSSASFANMDLMVCAVAAQRKEPQSC